MEDEIKDLWPRSPFFFLEAYQRPSHKKEGMYVTVDCVQQSINDLRSLSCLFLHLEDEKRQKERA